MGKNEKSMVVRCVLQLMAALVVSLLFAAAAVADVRPTQEKLDGTFIVTITEDFVSRSVTSHSIETRGKRVPVSLDLPDKDLVELAESIAGARVRLRGTYDKSRTTFTAGSISVLSPIRPGQTPTAGERKVAALMLKFPDTEQHCSDEEVRNLLFDDPSRNTVDRYYREVSRNQISFSGEVFSVFEVARGPEPCNYQGWSARAMAEWEAQGHDHADYDHVMFVLPQGADCGFSGRADLGPGQWRSWMRTCTLSKYVHELGHNLGLRHASTPTAEYGDRTDVMGFGGFVHFNAPHKHQLGLLTSGEALHVTDSGTYQIAPLEVTPRSTSLPLFITIDKADTAELYYVSYRRPIGMDQGLVSDFIDKVYVHSYPGSGVFKTFLLSIMDDTELFEDTLNGVRVEVLDTQDDYATVQVTLP